MIRRQAAMLLVDCQMAIRSGKWTPTRSASPFSAMTTVERLLVSPASDDEIAVATDRLYDIVGQAMMAGEATMLGYEQLELGDLTDMLFAPTPLVAANDDMKLRIAA